MRVFVINSGSSSVKYQLIQMPEAKVLCSGLIDRIGLDGSTIEHKTYLSGIEKIIKKGLPIPNHEVGLKETARLLTDDSIGVIKDPNEIDVVGHRVVHGGESFSNTMIITEKVKEKIKELFSLAPLHNPPNYLGIEVAEKIFTQAKQVAVFDTAFHQTMPPVAYRIAIPNKFYQENKIRNYGFHGTSHKYVSKKAIEYLKGISKNLNENRHCEDEVRGNPQFERAKLGLPRDARDDGKIFRDPSFKVEDTKIIVIHLGNGCSMSAVLNGKCIDGSMGFGPMNGLIMGTRTGDIDQSVIFYLVNQLGYTLDEVNTILNKKSGMLGLTGNSDMRDVQADYHNGNKEAILAYEMYAYHIKKYIGSFIAVLNGVDALVFTAGVGENDELTRKLSMKGLEIFNIYLDEVKNNTRSKSIREINQEQSHVKILVIPTNEELEIAEQCAELFG